MSLFLNAHQTGFMCPQASICRHESFELPRLKLSGRGLYRALPGRHYNGVQLARQAPFGKYK